MRKTSLGIVILTLLMSALGCSNRNVKATDEQLNQAQTHNAELQAQINDLQARLMESEGSRKNYQDSLRTLDSMIEQQDVLIKDLDMQVKKYQAQEPKQLSPAPLLPPVVAQTTPALSDNYQADYDKARGLFEKKSFKQAEAIYTALLQSEPDHKLASNCQYWLGECYYGQKQYETALAEFQRVFTYAKAPKADAAQLKIAVCYMQLKKYEEAREELNRLLSAYPSSEYVPRARALLDQLP
ncbi:MAG: tetratricopeptide repeat protein [bacterium]|nr:tetratricopeptide repeat protein [bacterium]